MARKRRLREIVLLFSVIFPAVVFAGSGSGLSLPPLADEPERGIKAGEFLIKPLLDLQAVYDTNYFREDAKETPVSVFLLKVAPGIGFVNPSASTFKLDLALRGEYRHFFTDDKNVKAQGEFGGSGDLAMLLFPQGKFQLTVFDNFRRELQTTSYSSTGTYNRIYNKGGLTLMGLPGGGALKISGTYGFILDYFEDLKYGRSYSHTGRFLITWNFLPKTTIFIDSTVDYIKYFEEDLQFRQNVRAMPLKVYLGMNGYITKKLTLKLMAGYGNSFHESGEKFQSFIGETVLGYKFLPSTILELGFERDFANSFYANYYVMHRGNLKFQLQIMSRVNIIGEFAYAHLSYSAFSPAGLTVNQIERADNALQGSVNLEFSIARVLMVTASYNFDSIFTDFELTSSGFVDYGGYMRHSIFGGLRLLY